MISELDDNEILNILMTSEFADDYSPVELKFLLLKWRYFYRLLNGKLERLSTDNEYIIQLLEGEIEALRKNIFDEQRKNAKNEDLIHQMTSRKLTWKERLKGKIINKNED